MSAFAYRDGHYCIEDVPIYRIADECGTPFYGYSKAAIEASFEEYSNAFADRQALVCYAIKANSNQAIIGLLAGKGAGADVVSGGELRRALAAGIPASKIVFSGVAKTVQEIELALEQEIRQFNVESEPELDAINAVATRIGKIARIAFRINPNVDAGAHEKISTGKSENKFGIAWSRARAAYAIASKLPAIEICGIDMHIGSQILSLEPFAQAFDRIASLVKQLRDDGHTISSIDLGGGLGLQYDGRDKEPPTPAEYAQLVERKLGHLDCQLILEPGRYLVGNAGVLVGRVIYAKHGSESVFLIIDAAMNDFLRPSMYDAYHNIVGARQTDAQEVIYDIVGPVCESGDTFAKRRAIAAQEPGDLVVIEGAGAYGSVMASTYNTRPIAPEILVDGPTFGIIKERPDVDSIIAQDLPWQPSRP